MTEDKWESLPGDSEASVEFDGARSVSVDVEPPGTMPPTQRAQYIPGQLVTSEVKEVTVDISLTLPDGSRFSVNESWPAEEDDEITADTIVTLVQAASDAVVKRFA